MNSQRLAAAGSNVMSSGSKTSGLNKVTTGQSIKASAMVPASSKITAANKKYPKRPP